MSQNALDEVCGHFFNHVCSVVHIQLVHDVVQLFIAECFNKHRLFVRIHISERVRCKLFWEQAKHKRHLFTRQVFKKFCHVCRVHVFQKIAQLGEIFILQQL